MSESLSLLTILGLAIITGLTRGFFLIPRRPVPIPAWLESGLRYAPLATLAAIVAPEVLLTHGHLVDTWREPRLFAVVAASLWFYWRRSLLGTILSGSIVFLALHLGLGW